MAIEPVNPMERFNRRFANFRQKKGGEKTEEIDNSEDNAQPKKKKRNSTNDLSQLGELIQENENNLNEEQGGEMVDKKITQEMREELNALGMDDETINGLSYDVATDILKDKDNLSKTLDHITDTQKITQEMRNGLNALGMDDETINGLSFNDALGILKDKDEISKKLDELGKEKEPDEIKVNEKDAPHVPVHEPHEDLDWIDEKVRDYNQMKESGNTDIKVITPDKTAGTFTAEIDNGTVTYTSKNDLTITKDSSYKVFDMVMKEPSNAGKAVRIPEDATPEFKTNLFIAAVLNEHKVNGAEGLELDSATMEKIGLTPEQKAKVAAAISKKEAKTEDKTEDKTKEAKTEEKTVEVSKEVTEAIAKMDESKKKLAEMIKEGKVTAAITSNAETKKSEIAFNYDPTKGGTEADAAQANKLLSDAIKAVGALRKSIPDDKEAAEQVVLDNYAIKAAQLDLIRSVYQPEQSETVKAMDRIRAKKLGLTDEKVERDVAMTDEKGNIIYKTNKKGEPLYKRDADGNIMYEYKRDKDGHFIRDEKTGELVRDKSKPILVAKTEKQEVKTLEGDELGSYSSKLSAGIFARIKSGHESK